MSRACLKVGGRTYVLESGVTHLGRDDESDVLLDGPKVSGRHALIVQTDTGHVLYDFKSINGVRVDGRKVEDKLELRHGQLIDIGGFSIEFVEDRSAAQPARSVGPGPTDPPHGPPREPDSAERLRRSIEKDVFTLIQEKPSDEDLVSKLLILFKVSSIVNSIVDTDTLLEQIVELALEVMAADRAILMMPDPEGKLETTILRIRGSQPRVGAGKEETDGAAEPDADGAGSFSQSIALRCFETGEPVFTNDVGGDSRFAGAKSVQLYHIRSALCVALTFRNSRRGVLYTDNRKATGSFTSTDLLLLRAFAEQAAVAIENSVLLNELKASLSKIQGQQEMLVQAEKMAAMGHLAAGLAHEIRNPLTAITGYAEMYFRRFPPESPFFAQMRIIESAAFHMGQIVDGLLDFSRRGPRQVEPTSINRVVEQTLLLGRPALSKYSRIRIVQDLDGEIPEVSIDCRQVQQVFLNLVMNAVQAMAAGGVLTIRSRPHWNDRAARPSHVVVEFEDTGSGIPEELQLQVFQPFFTSGKMGGTGLGLTISKSIVEGHGGTITFRSTAGSGTTFCVTLPLEPCDGGASG